MTRRASAESAELTLPDVPESTGMAPIASPSHCCVVCFEHMEAVDAANW